MEALRESASTNHGNARVLGRINPGFEVEKGGSAHLMSSLRKIRMLVEEEGWNSFLELARRETLCW